MDSSRDNPFIRFTTFWWALGTFLLFGVLIGIVWLFTRQEPATLEDLAAEARYKTKEEITKAQAAVIPKEAIDQAVETVSVQLLATKPAAVESPAQIIPGSKTAIEIANNKGIDPAEINKAAAESTDAPDPASMEAGKLIYLSCMGCHGPNGEGMAGVAPPLADSEWVTGPLSNLVLIQFRGLTGPIKVAGKDYEFPVGMFAMGITYKDEELASLLTYIRNSFGNKASAIKPEWITPFRSEIGKPPLLTSELITPEAK